MPRRPNMRTMQMQNSIENLVAALSMAINSVECASVDSQTGEMLPWYRAARKALGLKDGETVPYASSRPGVVSIQTIAMAIFNVLAPEHILEWDDYTLNGRERCLACARAACAAMWNSKSPEAGSGATAISGESAPERLPNDKSASLLQRYRDAKLIWSEDECSPDAETIEHAWLRLFGDPFPYGKRFISFTDLGDCTVYEYSTDRFARVGPRRSGLTEIRVLNPTKRASSPEDLVHSADLAEFARRLPDNPHPPAATANIRYAEEAIESAKRHLKFCEDEKQIEIGNFWQRIRRQWSTDEIEEAIKIACDKSREASHVPLLS